MEERKLLLRFEKLGTIRMISHLDMARLFARAFRRAGISVKYSEGFHAHPKLVFSLPLSVGTESLCETCAVTLLESCRLSEQEILEALNRTLPKGMRITQVFPLTAKPPATTHAIFSLTLSGLESEEYEKLTKALQGPLPVTKRTKKGETLLDLSALIKDPILDTGGGDAILTVTLPASDEMTVNPSLLITALQTKGFPDVALARALRRACI